MAESLDNTVALVSGASSGIGRATALELASRGAAVALAARRRGKLEEVAAAIEAGGGKALVIETTLTNSAAAAEVVEQTVAGLGRIDILINAAGTMMNGPTVESPVADWEEVLAVNVDGLVFLTKAAIPHLLAAVEDGARGVADLVNLGSIAGRAAKAEVALYNFTKFGVTGFTEALRQEFTQRGLRVSAIEPGWVDTAIFSNQRPETAKRFEGLLSQVEVLRPEDIAESIAYIVTRPRRVAINEMLIRPTEQI